MLRETFSLHEARRVTLAAQGFDRPRPARKITVRDVRRTILRLGLLQLDYVNVLVPAHYAVLFSRLGAYDRALLDTLVYRKREFTEQWAHEASVVPVGIWPLLRSRREAYRARPREFETFLSQFPEYVEFAIEQVRTRGALTADDLPEPDGTSRRMEHAWFGTIPRAVLETHFGRGALAVAERRTNLARAFDLAERVIPFVSFATVVDPQDAQRGLLHRAAKAYGIATAADLADYYRMPVKESKLRLAELVEAGTLLQVRVEGWREAAYLDPDASVPRRIGAATLLSPFDPLIWYRPRVSRLFGFDYRIEIYTPEAQRTWGYYVLPFLFGEKLVARVDLKADRTGSRLLVRAAHVEPGADAAVVAAGLATELRAWADWLNLAAIIVERRGNLASPLVRQVRAC
jgi:uncharacterized protein